jgi:hypothetical protein
MNEIWHKLRPHLLSWHMVPCVVMLAAAVGIAIATGRGAGVFGAVACMAMMMVMMSMMGGHHDNQTRRSEKENDS